MHQESISIEFYMSMEMILLSIIFSKIFIDSINILIFTIYNILAKKIFLN